MKPLLITVSMLALAAALGSSIACANGGITAETNKLILLGATVAWFVVAPFWMLKPRP
ncbi:MAG: hypothetical protein K9N23_01775 [Akkermansiaceae bacterium]|nr:hypothetical protein [Akkermansiaceae bacterium]MCF7730379.1 hypothetical protein [Akkermansiaceae bacterium]